MTKRSMDVFSLRDTVVGEYRKFVTSFTTIHAEDIRQQVEAIYAEGRFWPEPLIQINPSDKKGANLANLIDGGALDPRTADIFRADGEPLSLYKHQEQAIALAAQGESYVVTTGTGSGKSLCFFIPIVNAVLAEKRTRKAPRTRAIIIYPMNALANSQLEELDKFIKNVPGEKPVTFARYTGQEDTEERRRISENQPDVLLTNFMMLELLMTRRDELDRRVIRNCAGLRFLVLDELHTYRGRQGADVALLVRRVRERLSPEKLQCIGTSATMASEGSLEDKGRVVARVASMLFSIEIPESNVIVETLERVTDSAQSAESVKGALGPAIDAGLASNISDAALRTHPLTTWVETRFGVSWSEVDQRWVRARPLTVEEAARALSTDAGRGVSVCRSALRSLLLVSSVPERDRTGLPEASARSFFAFKLHQFISGAGHAYATLEAPGLRTVTVDGRQFLPGEPDKRLYPVHFCRDCGHEYHPVRFVTDGGEKSFLARDIDDAAPARPDDDESAPDDADDAADREIFGFLTTHARDADFSFADRDEDYPETWLEYDASGNPRLKVHYRGARARSVAVASNGKLGAGTKAWFLPGKFRFCLRCGATQGGAARASDEAVRRIRRVLDLLEDDLTEELAPWYPGRDEFATEVVGQALGRFDRAFNRWRDLFLAAEQQRDAAHRTESDYSAPPAEKKAAKSRYLQARDQLELLQKGTSSQSSDFYTYRYLATEGFLPGYNFPRLPLMAYVPATNDGRGRQTYLQRPRFLALSEFGPRSLVYHEGRAYRVVRALLSLSHQGSATPDTRLPTKSVRICRTCGAGHWSDQASMCHVCGASLGDAEIVNHVYRIENVATQPAERITANDEERQRQGFELQTTFEWAVRDHIVDVRRGAAADAHGEIVPLAYGPGATITRLNKGLRRRANRTQFGCNIDPVSGYWAKNEDEGDEPTDPTASPRQWIFPSVQDRKNALLLQPTGQELSQATLATLQHALLRGIEAVFQLEEGEILAEPMPKRDERSGFLLYEATEGGAGVLTRLVAEPERLAEVARKALSIMHFAVTDEASLPADGHGLVDAPDTACVAACYRCLMSYFNQPDHERIDRRDLDAKSLLMRLARAMTSGLGAPPVSRRSSRPSAAPGADNALTRFGGLARARELPSPDAEPLWVGEVQVPLVWGGHYVAVLLDGALAAVTRQLEDKGFEVISFDGDEAAWTAALERLTRALGRSS